MNGCVWNVQQCAKGNVKEWSFLRHIVTPNQSERFISGGLGSFLAAMCHTSALRFSLSISVDELISFVLCFVRQIQSCNALR